MSEVFEAMNHPMAKWGRGWMLTTADMHFFWDHFCPPRTERSKPRASPLHVADGAGLPPAFVCVAQLDPLRDEGLAFVRKLAKAGIEVESRCDPGVLYAYLAGAAAWLKGHCA